MLIKICGLTSAQNASEVAAAGATHIGLVFAPSSPRAVSLEQASAITAILPPHVKRCGVFVNEAPDIILDLAALLRLDCIQLHGDESPDCCADLRASSGAEVIKALAVETPADLARAEAFRGTVFRGAVSMFLLDSKSPQRGGSGMRIPRELLLNIDLPAPFFLSGGLSPENIDEALDSCSSSKLFGVDASSGLESQPGVKDITKVVRFIERIRRHVQR